MPPTAARAPSLIACVEPRKAGLDRWERIVALDESELEQRLYPPSTAPVIRKQRPPDWTRIREELARHDHHVTLALQWNEYKAEHLDGYQ
jgi:hypothetical protein